MSEQRNAQSKSNWLRRTWKAKPAWLAALVVAIIIAAATSCSALVADKFNSSTGGLQTTTQPPVPTAAHSANGLPKSTTAAQFESLKISLPGFKGCEVVLGKVVFDLPRNSDDYSGVKIYPEHGTKFWKSYTATESSINLSWTVGDGYTYVDAFALDLTGSIGQPRLTWTKANTDGWLGWGFDPGVSTTGQVWLIIGRPNVGC